jgi:hypothetical protein
MQVKAKLLSALAATAIGCAMSVSAYADHGRHNHRHHQHRHHGHYAYGHVYAPVVVTRPVYVERPVYYYERPVYYAPAPVYYPPVHHSGVSLSFHIPLR